MTDYANLLAIVIARSGSDKAIYKVKINNMVNGKIFEFHGFLEFQNFAIFVVGNLCFVDCRGILLAQNPSQ